MIRTRRIMTLSTMTLSIMTLSKLALSIRTLSIGPLSKMTLRVNNGSNFVTIILSHNISYII
jgi:hypothetical protein